jgi:hypothetical protein
MNNAPKIILSIFLFLLGAIGLTMTLCGGYFTIMTLSDSRNTYGVAYFSSASLFLGMALAWVAYHFGIRRPRIRRDQQTQSDQPASADTTKER